MYAKLKVPFEYQNKKDFPSKLADWVGDVFYDILPEHGYEVREEQIFTAFQIADVICKEKVHFAEAGLGTGKTFAYLLTAVAYARFIGKPVVIACASTALQEQLAGPKGDIEKLSQLLDLNIHARMAKDPRQYICDIRVDRSVRDLNIKNNKELDQVLSWSQETKLGERSEIPHISDGTWSQVAWDETMSCEMCSKGGFCKLVRARENYRQAQDLIISDHGIFFDDLWTRDERIDEEKSPLLPNYSAVIFDEGHQVILPASMRAGRQIVKEDMETMVATLEDIQGARSSLLSSTLATELATEKFFKSVYKGVIKDEGTDRYAVGIDDQLLEAAETLYRALEELQFQLQNEQELHGQNFSDYLLSAYNIRIERAMEGLMRFYMNKGQDVIIWVDRADQSFWVVPRELSGMMKRNLFDKKVPVIFSSATLSTGGDFSYFSRILGLKDFSSSTVGSSFDFKKQARVYIPENVSSSMEHLVSLLQFNKGRALILTNSLAEVKKIRAGLKAYQLPFDLLWEDQGERGFLIRKFREDISSVLVGSGFWEGIDVAGEALSLVVIWQLPFPPLDPLIEARRFEARNEGLDPMTTVDYPEMGLKLKQGCGRLIRTSEDRGTIAIMEPVIGTPWEQIVMAALPVGAEVINKLDKVK